MKEQFTEPVIQIVELRTGSNVMDEPVFISGNAPVQSTVIKDSAEGYNIWKGKQH